MKKFGFIAVAVLMLLSSCDTYTSTGALAGGMVGSTVGRVFGGYRGSDVGALVGAAIGAAAGASAREAEIRRAEQRYYDDVYDSRSYSRVDKEKAARVARYHANTEARYSSRGSKAAPTRSQNGFSFETQGRSYNQNNNTEKDNSGYTEKATYDDRIDIK